MRRARRELGGLEHEQAVRQKSRARHLLTLGRSAVSSEGYDHPALSKAREQLGVVEDERAQHTATVSAADSELVRVRADRAEKAKVYAARSEETLPATCESSSASKEVPSRAQAASPGSLRLLDARSLRPAAILRRKDKLDPHRSIRAREPPRDRSPWSATIPLIADDLDALNPRVAALEARRPEARKRDRARGTQEDQGRPRSGARRSGRAHRSRSRPPTPNFADKILLELGDRIYVDRPPNMAFELTPIDAIDVELGSTDRRMMELREIIGSVDKIKLARGIAIIILVLAGLGSLTGWLIHVFA